MRTLSLKVPLSFRLLLAGMLIGGCAIGPEYQKPEIQLPDAWHTTVMHEPPDQLKEPIQSWWEIFNDAELNRLIIQARESNLTLQSALASVREARARLAYTGAQNLPEASAYARPSTTKLSDNGILSQVAPPGGFESQGLMVFGLDAAWEIDVFGRIRREVEAEGARFEASVERYRGVMISLYAEVALAYIDIRSWQAQIANAEQNIRIQSQSLDLTKERFRDGLTSALDVEQAKFNLYATEAAVPEFRIHMNEAYNRLAVLCGTDAGTLQGTIGDPGSLPVPVMDITTGVPADLLRQRPDVRGAEREVAAATAMIGVAMADLYPSFALMGSIGLGARSGGDLFDSSSLVWSLSAPAHWNIFTGGRVRDRIEIMDQRTQKAVLDYRQTVLEALEEVENALSGFNDYQIRQERLQDAVQATEHAVELVTVQYTNGLTDFNNVLDMQRALYEQQNKFVTSRTDWLRSVVKLYKSLGGGWQATSNSGGGGTAGSASAGRAAGGRWFGSRTHAHPG